MNSKFIISIPLFLTFVSSIVLSSSIVSASDVEINDVSIAVPVSCNISSVLNEAHNATIIPGRNVADIGTTTFTTLCNDASGYSIYAIGYSNEEYGNTNLLATIGGTLAPSEDIITGTATNGNTSNWSMKLASVAGTSAPTILSDTNGSFASYHVVPTTYTKVATLTTAVNATVGSQFATTYQTYIDGTKPSGTYSGKVKYTLVHPNDSAPAQPQPSYPGYISYYANSGDVVGTMGRQHIGNDYPVQLFASNFSREGYGFAGWSDVFDYETNPDAHFYGPNENLEDYALLNNIIDEGLALYAVWVPSAGEMQDYNTVASLCRNQGDHLLNAAVYNDKGDPLDETWDITADLLSISALTDARDNQTYAIARLTDGNCWMIENLRIADTHQEGNTVVPTTLTVDNTNNPLRSYGSLTVTLKHNYSDTQAYTNLSPTSDTDTGANGWCVDNSPYCINQSRVRTDNTTNRATYTTTTDMSSHDANLYSYGNYYNWYSATAGNGVYTTGSNDITMPGDLCPNGWMLPVGGNNKPTTYGNLSNSLGGLKDYNTNALPMENDNTIPSGTIMDARLRHFPINFLHSGYVEGALIHSRGSDAAYWSRVSVPSVSRPATAYTLSFGSPAPTSGRGGYVYPGMGYNYMYSGWTIRCVYRNN